MFNKTKSIKGWVYWSNDQSSGEAYQPGKIYNNLDKKYTFEAYMSINGGPVKGAGKKDPSTGDYKKEVVHGNPLEMDNYLSRVQYGTNLEQAELIFIFDEMPSKDGVDGVKIAPGTRGGAPHHVEFRKEGTKYQARLHYKNVAGSNKGSVKMMEDVDPNVGHPGGG